MHQTATGRPAPQLDAGRCCVCGSRHRPPRPGTPSCIRAFSNLPRHVAKPARVWRLPRSAPNRSAFPVARMGGNTCYAKRPGSFVAGLSQPRPVPYRVVWMFVPPSHGDPLRVTAVRLPVWCHPRRAHARLVTSAGPPTRARKPLHAPTTTTGPIKTLAQTVPPPCQPECLQAGQMMVNPCPSTRRPLLQARRRGSAGPAGRRRARTNASNPTCPPRGRTRS